LFAEWKLVSFPSVPSFYKRRRKVRKIVATANISLDGVMQGPGGVLDWSAKDAADLLDLSVPAVNSALQRARVRLRERLPSRKPAWPADTDASAAERDLLRKYVERANRRMFGLSNRSSVRTRPSACRPTSPRPKAVTRCSSYGAKKDSALSDLAASAAL